MPLYLADDLAHNPPAMQPSLIGAGLLPETGCLLLTGKTETGKSVVGMDMALSLALGMPLFGASRPDGTAHFPVRRPVKVLYLDSELGPPGAHQRLKLFYQQKIHGVCLEDMFKIVSGDFAPLSLHNAGDTAFQNLEGLVAAEKPGVLIVDPFSDYHSADENDNSIRLVFAQLRMLQKKYTFASILLHHESDKDIFIEGGTIAKRKGTGRARGHSSIAQSVDTMLAVRREKRNPYTFLELSWEKCRHQTRPPTSWCFIDFTRMKLIWLGSSHKMHPGARLAFLNSYMNAHPLDMEDMEEE